MRFFLVIFVIATIAFYWDDLTVPSALPVPPHLIQKIYTDPIQETTTRPQMNFGDGQLTFMATYELTARVMMRKEYDGRTGKVAPVDFALGWGPMSAPNMAKRLNMKQRNRWYYYGWRGMPPLPIEQIIINSANVHMIPANDAIKEQLLAVRKNQIVTLKGYLVNYTESRENMYMELRTSMTRHDTRGGSCEIFYVESLTVHQ